MATYNGARFLQEQLDSLARQRCRPSGLVVCDDGSTDATIDILRSFESVAPFPTRVIQNDERLGYKRNFMKAASLCSGPIIAFCDQDDIWNGEKLCALTGAFRDEHSLLISHDFSIISDSAQQIFPSYYERLAGSGFSRALSIKGCTMAFRRELVECLGWPDPQSGWSHDAWVALTATAFGRRSYISQPLIEHRIHGNNASGSLIGGSRITPWIRKINLSPFTSDDDIDALIDFCFDPGNFNSFVDAISNPTLDMPADRRAYLIGSLRKKDRLNSFRRSDVYSHLLRRAVDAVKLFFSLNYTVGDGLPGLLSDIAGRRPVR
jgi:glycosyltransferase involved in cell wall biosynthesis